MKTSALCEVVMTKISKTSGFSTIVAFNILSSCAFHECITLIDDVLIRKICTVPETSPTIKWVSLDDSSNAVIVLQPPATFKAFISMVCFNKKGETVSIRYSFDSEAATTVEYKFKDASL